MIKMNTASQAAGSPAQVAAVRRATRSGARRYVMTDALRSYLRSKYLGENSSRGWAGTGWQGPTFSVVSIAARASSEPAIAPQAAEGTARRIGRAALAGAKILALAATAILFAALAFQGQAHASSLVLATPGAIIGQGTDTFTFDVTGPGTLDVSLTDFSWPFSSFKSLSLEIASSSNLLQSMDGAGQMSVQLTSAGTYYAYVTGQAATSSFGIDWGTFGLVGTLTSPVPLPASISMLIAGCLALAWSIRRRSRKGSDADLGAAILPMAH